MAPCSSSAFRRLRRRLAQNHRGLVVLAVVTGLLFLGLVGSAGASWLWYRLVREGELIPLTGLTLLTPAFALMLALLIIGEERWRVDL